MLELLRLLAEADDAISWIAIFIAAVIAVFVAYVGVAMYATLRTHDPDQQKIRYKVFQDLLRVFAGKSHR
jgi:hypothetical protein